LSGCSHCRAHLRRRAVPRKAIANYCLLLAVELVSLPVFGIFYNVRWTQRFPN